jgi:hypothetical protein
MRHIAYIYIFLAITSFSSLIAEDTSIDFPKILKALVADPAFQEATKAALTTMDQRQQSRVSAAIKAMQGGRSITPTNTSFDSLLARALAPRVAAALPDGELRSALSNAAQTIELASLLTTIDPKASLPEALPIIISTTKLTAPQKKTLEKRFEDRMWSAVGDTMDYAEFYFQKGGSVIRLNGPPGKQWGRQFPWTVMDDGVVQVGEPGVTVRTYWFWFESASSGAYGELKFQKDGLRIPPERRQIALQEGKKLPNYAAQQPK